MEKRKMSVKIGIRDVQSMPPHTILWDQSVRGFHARRQFGDAVTFAVFYRNTENRQRWHKIGRFGVWTPDQARKEAQRVLRARDLGEDPTAERMALRNALTMIELCDDYIKDMQSGALLKKPSTIESDISRINKHIKPALGNRKVTGVTQDDVEHFMRSMKPGIGRRTITLLGAIFTYAVKRKLRTDNPAHGIEKPNGVRKTRRLSDLEYTQLWAALQREHNLVNEIFLLLAVTGFRSGEIKNLRWSECDLERKVVTLEDTKTGMSIRPLSSAAVAIIKRQPQICDYVFQHKHDLTRWWAKLEMPGDVTPHTLRHSFASLAADLGVADHTISGLLGHARNGITSRYLHLGDKALLEASDIVANETMRLMKA
jgi:integrase